MAVARVQRGRGAREWTAIALLLVGSIIAPILGWLAGVGVLWSSRAWTRAEKLVGTLVLPGGWGLAPLGLLLLSSGDTCTYVHGRRTCGLHRSSTTSLVIYGLLLLLLLAPVASAVFLARRAAAGEGKASG